MKNLTILVCNYNTPKLIENLLKSIKKVSETLPKMIVVDTSTDEKSSDFLSDVGVKYYKFHGATHGDAVNLGLSKVKTDYVLLVDSDVIFLQDLKKPFDTFVNGNFTLMGKVVGDCAGKSLYPRVEPWYCFIHAKNIKDRKIKFFDRERTRTSKKLGIRIYDVGSTMYEDVVDKFGLYVADVNMEGKYFKHYGGMSWHVESFNPSKGDTDIDFGGTHPHKVLHDHGVAVRDIYKSETSCLSDINIKDVFSDE